MRCVRWVSVGWLLHEEPRNSTYLGSADQKGQALSGRADQRAQLLALSELVNAGAELVGTVNAVEKTSTRNLCGLPPRHEALPHTDEMIEEIAAKRSLLGKDLDNRRRLRMRRVEGAVLGKEWNR